METFGLWEAQAGYILDTPLRRLTRYDKLELEPGKEELQAEIAELNAILGSDRAAAGGRELTEVAKKYGTPRRTVLLDSASRAKDGDPLEVADDPCLVLLSSTGLMARTADASRWPVRPSAPPDVLVSAVRTTVRGEVGVVTSQGRMIRVRGRPAHAAALR